MSKEDLMKYREEQDRKETKKMFDAIHENYKKANKKYHEQQEKEYNAKLLKEQQDKIKREKEQKKEVIVNFALVVVVILTLFSMMIAMLSFSTKSNKGSVEGCITAGFPQNYCENQL